MKAAVNLALPIALATASVAAPTSAALAQPGGTVIDQNRVDRTPPRPNAPAPATPPNRGQAQIETLGESDAALRSVSFDGSTLDPARLQAAVAPFVGQPLNRTTITAAAQAVSKAYEKSNVALHVIQAPQQDLSQGQLRLSIVEGHVAQVALGKVKGGQHAIPLVQAYARPIPLEKPLTRRTMERQLSLMRDIPGATITPQLLPGQAPGAAVLGVDVGQRRWDVTTSIINRRNPALGQYQIQVDLNGYALLRPGDQTTLSIAAPTEVERFQYVALSHSQAIGDDGLRIAGNIGYLRTRPKAPFAKGDAELGGLQAQYPIIRGFNRNLYAVVAVDTLKSSNALINQVPTSEKTTTGRAGLSYSDQTPTRSIAASATGSYGDASLRGAPLPGGLDDSFTKLNLRAGIDQALGKLFVVRLKGVAQLSGDRLASSELISLGGEEFGRAYPATVIIGDRGYAGSAELAWRPSFVPTVLQGSEVYVFGDGGTVRLASRYGGLLPASTRDLSSAGVGVRAAWKRKTILGVEAARAMNAPSPRYEGDWRFGFSLRSEL